MNLRVVSGMCVGFFTGSILTICVWVLQGSPFNFLLSALLIVLIVASMIAHIMIEASE